MLSKAVSRFVRYSPFKLRVLADELRGKRLDLALAWLNANKSRRVQVFEKIFNSAWANAKVKNGDLKEQNEVFVGKLLVDQGPYFKYTIPGAMGRGVIRRRRTSHVYVEISSVKS